MSEIRIIDEDHLWYKGMQYISLKRFAKFKNDQIDEMSLLNKEVENLTKENEAYKTLLRGELNE